MLLLFWQSGLVPPPPGPTHTGKSAALGLTFTGEASSLSLVFTGKGQVGGGYTDILAVDGANSLAVDAVNDLQVDVVAALSLTFTGKSSAIVV
jgi:hypothetical protein